MHSKIYLLNSTQHTSYIRIFSGYLRISLLSIKWTWASIIAQFLSFLIVILNTYLCSYVKAMGFPVSSVGKESACNGGDLGSSPGPGRSPGEGIGYLIKCCWASHVAQLVKNPPAMLETWGRSLVGKIPWRRERLPTPVFWPGESYGLYGPRGRKESNTTEQLSLSSLHR